MCQLRHPARRVSREDGGPDVAIRSGGGGGARVESGIIVFSASAARPRLRIVSLKDGRAAICTILCLRERNGS